VLISGVDDPDADVARVSAAALAQLGTPAVLPALMHALADNRTRGIAMTGLGRMGPPAVAAAPEFLDSMLLTREASERSTAEQALKAMGATAVPAVVDVLRNDKEDWKRNEAALALGRLGAAASGAVPALIDTFRYGNTLSANAAEVLGQIGAPAVPALTAALKCDHLAPAPAAPISGPWRRQSEYPETEYVRMYAATALSRVGGPAKAAAIPALREALSDASPGVRDAAAHALYVLERPDPRGGLNR
jgi:HEAT repeat protein